MEEKEKELSVTLHEVFSSVKFDDVVETMKKYDERYMLRWLHNYKIEFDNICNTVPDAEGDGQAVECLQISRKTQQII